jgi:molybdate transport system substrate-binding protein
VRFSFAASSTLAKQIESGAEADIFASADEQWMDYLAQRGRLDAATRRSRLGNTLVLVTPADQPRTVDIRPGFNLAALIGDGRLATGDPAHVPVGRYAQEALTNLGVWDAVGPRLARTDNVRAALILVERGEAPFGIVYGTDAAASVKVRVAGVFPAGSHAPISYPMAIVAKRDRPEVRRFYEFLLGPEAAAVFGKAGFVVR